MLGKFKVQFWLSFRQCYFVANVEAGAELAWHHRQVLPSNNGKWRKPRQHKRQVADT